MLFSVPLAIALAASDPLPIATAPNPPASGLPSGDSTEWRSRMLDWSTASRPEEPRGEPLLMEKPLATGRLSSVFGLRSDPLGGSQRHHRGVDIASPMGTPVVASTDGRVSFAGSAGGYGRMVQIDGPAGMQIRYGHLSRVIARAGSVVRRGDLIGAVGSTGRSTGSHLHFEIRIDGTAVDPLRPLPLRRDIAPIGAPVAQNVDPRWTGFTDPADALPAAYR